MVVARVTYGLVGRGVPGQPRPALRVTGFSKDETRAAVAALQELVSHDNEPRLTIKVGTNDPAIGLPEECRLKRDETLTYWRNQPVSSIVLFDWDAQRDEEGLAAVNRLDDHSLLFLGSADAADDRFELIAATAWGMANGTGKAPSHFVSAVHAVWEVLGIEYQFSLRRWTAYVLEASEFARSAPLATDDASKYAAAMSLPVLGLFPDPDLFTSPGAIKSRLERNRSVSTGNQPNGSAIEDEDVLALINTADLPMSLLDRAGLTDASARELMGEVLTQRSDSARRSLELSLWLALFERRLERAGLGQLVREALTRTAHHRVAEFDALDVGAGLDQSEQAAAERFLLAEPVEGEPPLTDVVPVALQRRVQKVAFPDAQIEPDPLRALLHALTVLDDGGDGTVQVKLEGPPDVGEWSRWLFAVLYGPTLGEVRESAGLRLTLEIDDALVIPRRPELPSEEEGVDWSEEWAPLRLAVEVQGVGKRRFRWDPSSTPGLTTLAALLNGYEVAPGEEVDCDADAFFERFTDPRDWTRQPPESAFGGPVTSDLAESRAKHLGSWRNGLSARGIGDYLADWELLINRAREDLVPAAAPEPDLAGTVLDDVLQLADGHLLMLATHPLRLRWQQKHLLRMTRFIVKALTEGLVLNTENNELFFDSLQRVSPHGTPPVIVGADETVAIAVRESAGHEEYVPIRQHGQDSRDWLSAVDDTAVEELVRVITSYLDTYPHKLDGLSVLLLDRSGSPRLPLRVAKRIRAKNPRVRLELVVMSDRSVHHEIIQAFDHEFADDEVPEDRLLPDVQLLLRDWDTEGEPDLAPLRDRVDIALAPALFGTRTKLNEKTREASAGISGLYDPWIHSPTHNLIESSQNVVRAMLPSPRDPLLETWSTLCVRHEAHSAVAPESVGNTDYFEMQVRFDRQQKLFLDLHDVAHWVVTLDAFIGRDQIDALEDRPDVILVKPRIGKNEAYTLIVSSQTGGRFVVKRLNRRLVEIGVVDQQIAQQTAERLYQVGRNVVPGAVLRSLGIGSTVNEIVGVVATRFAVTQQCPVPVDRPGLEIWIGFDEQQRWFGRAQRQRADLGRFTLTIDPDDEVRLDILVAESKFRQAFDLGDAKRQLNRTAELCRSAFRSDEQATDDRDFWLEELASAIEQTSSVDQDGSELPASRRVGPLRDGLENTIMETIRSGRVRLDSVKGVAVAIAASATETAPTLGVLGDDHLLIRLNRPELRSIIGSLLQREDPARSVVSLKPVAPDKEHTTPAQPAIQGAADGMPGTATRSEVERSHLIAPQASTRVPVASHGGLGEEGLKAKYEALLDVLHQHNVSVLAPETMRWQEGPGFYVLRVIPKIGVTVDRVVGRVKEVQLALELPEGYTIRTALDRGTIAFEIPKVGDERYSVYASSLWAKCEVDESRLVTPVGSNIAGQPVQIDFSSPDSPHLLVAGTTGSGKSVALETVLRGLIRYTPDKLRLRLVDPKGTELVGFEEDPHLDGTIGSYPEDAVEILEDCVAEMEDRYVAMKSIRARSLVQFNASVSDDERKPWIVVVLDEYADLTSDPDDKSQIEGLLRRLTQKARAAGIHVIAATQRPSADVISTTIRSNLPAQLALRVKTAVDSRIIIDEPGAETLSGKGDALLRTTSGLQRLQVALPE